MSDTANQLQDFTSVFKNKIKLKRKAFVNHTWELKLRDDNDDDLRCILH